MKFVIDTNIIFSAMIKDSITRKLILSDVFELFVPEYLFEEIRDNAEIILEKTGMNEKDFTALLTLLEKHLKFVERNAYAEKLPVAEKEMKNIDVTDSTFLALAFALDCPIWSNDKHFKKQNLVKAYTTKEILQIIGFKN